MKYLRVALLVVASALTLARAQDDQENQKPPTEIPDFSNLDEYIYEPKSTVTIGFRHLSGAKAQFSGSGKINAPEVALPDINAENVTRTYHDGTVRPDTRTQTRLDASGNPLIDPATGTTVPDPITPDGKTTSWSYVSNTQLDAAHARNGYISFHEYSATVGDGTVRHADARSSNGFDLGVSHDMGTLFHSRVTWRLMGGFSVNDIAAKKVGNINATISTLTDYYFLNGHVPPSAPYSSPPGSSTQPVVDTNNNPVTSGNGTTQNVTVDTTVLLNDKPSGETTSTLSSSGTAVTDSWKVKGAYYSFRGGGELSFPFSSRFRANVSLGALLVYAGTSYTVVQTLTPDTGLEIPVTDVSTEHKLLPGFYADASLQYDVTDKAGLFAGAVFQTAGSYTQSLISPTANYATKIDLSNQNGFRAGLSVRF